MPLISLITPFAAPNGYSSNSCIPDYSTTSLTVTIDYSVARYTVIIDNNTNSWILLLLYSYNGIQPLVLLSMITVYQQIDQRLAVSLT